MIEVTLKKKQKAQDKIYNKTFSPPNHSTLIKNSLGTCRFKFWSLCIDPSSRGPNEVNLLFDRSKFSSPDREAIVDGSSTNLLLETFKHIKPSKKLISDGNVFILLNERSRYSNFFKRPISGGRYLHQNGKQDELKLQRLRNR